jgi:hypothetical protein
LKETFMRVRGIILGLGAMVLLSVPAARAQLAMYAQATGASLQLPNTAHVYGATFGFYDTKRLGLVAIGPDFRGAILKRGDSQGLYTDQALDTGLGGVRVTITPRALPLMPYGEATIGLGYWRGGVGTTRQDSTHAMMQLVAGVDYTIVPRVDWRVAEFSYGRVGGELGFINPETLSTGIVLRLP